MRQAIFLILILILTEAVTADTIRVTLEDAGNQRLRVGYEVTSGSTLPVGFGLDITLGNQATFQNVASASSYFPIYPGTVVISDGGKEFFHTGAQQNDCAVVGRLFENLQHCVL